MHSLTLVALAASSFVQSVLAHGYVQTLLINGKTYPAFDPNIDNYAFPLVNSKITRHVPDDGPVTDYTSDDMKCNVGAQDAQWRTSHTAEVTAGSDVSLTWVRWPDDHLGPITTWMADCGASCINFNGDGAVWFKIDELGLISGDTSTGDWATLHLIKNKLTWTVTIPASLASGNYLIRQEILALHSAHAPQFYPSCSQLVVKGSGTSKPAASELVAINKIYKKDTSTDIDIWTNPGTKYTIAGPPVTKLQSYSTTNAKNLNGASVIPSSQGSTSAPATTGSGTGSTTSGGTSGGASSGGSTGSTGSTPAVVISAGTGSSAGSGNSKTGKCRARKRATTSTTGIKMTKRHISGMHKSLHANKML